MRDKFLPEAFKWRGFNMCESLLRHTPEQLTTFFRRMGSLGFNAVIIHYDYGFKRYQELIRRECEANNIAVTLMVFGPRTFFTLANSDASAFAKNADGAAYFDEPVCETWPCFTASEAERDFRRGAEMFMRQLPSWISRIHMRAGDGRLFCRCPKCRNLLAQEGWNKFVRIFREAAQACGETRPIESDVYLYRHDEAHWSDEAMAGYGAFMYDTFGRHPRVALGDDPGRRTADISGYCSGDVSAYNNIGSYHKDMLAKWMKRAGHPEIYIHENTMMQGQLGVFTHNTAMMLKDLDFYRSIGLSGVFYEAYEPGYANFAAHYEVMAAALKGETTYADYTPDAVAQALDINVPFGYLDGVTPPEILRMLPEVTAKYMTLLENFWQNFTPETLLAAVEYAYEHKERFDHLYVAYFFIRAAIRFGRLRFDRASEDARYVMTHAKLWDYMEKLPLDVDPVAYTEKLLFELSCKAEKI